MNEESNYWKRLLASRLSRRRALQTGAMAGLGGMAAYSVACSGGGSKSNTPAAGGSPSGGGAANPTVGGDLTIAYSLNPSSLDPHLGNSGGDDFYWRAMFDTLIGVDQSYAPQKDLSLAQNWEQPDPNSLTFHIRPNVTLHDGTKLDADLVGWNMQRVKDPALKSTYAALMSPVDSVQSVDPLTAKFVLNAPDSALFGHLYQRAGAIISRTAAEKYGDQFGSHPVGTGPFVFQEWVPNSDVKMTKNANYWRKDSAGRALPYLNSVTMRIISDLTASLASLSTGQVQLTGIDPKDLDQTKSNSQFTVIQKPGTGVASLFVFNFDKPAVQDSRVRRAISAAANPDAVNKSVYFGVGAVDDGFMWAPGLWVYEAIAGRPKFDLNDVKAQLSAAGVSNPSIEMITWTDSTTMVQQTTLYQSQLKQAGINANITQFNVGTATANFFTNKQGDVFSTSWSMYPEPDNIATNNMAPTAFYNPIKRAIDPSVPDLLAKGRATYDQAQRKQVYTQLAKLSLDQGYYVPFIFGTGLTAASKKVQGLDTLFDGAFKWVYPQLWLSS